MKENFKILICFLFLFSLSAIFVCAQPVKLTKEQLVEKSNALFEGGKQREAIDLIDEYPEFADEVEILYVRSVAYTELRDYKNADIAFQKSFDTFLKNGTESLTVADEYAAKTAPTKEEKEIAAMMYSTAMIGFASAKTECRKKNASRKISKALTSSENFTNKRR